MVSFDSLVTAPSALELGGSLFELGRKPAQRLAERLGGEGHVIKVTGVPGTPDDTLRNAGADSAWKANPGMRVVNRYTGM